MNQGEVQDQVQFRGQAMVSSQAQLLVLIQGLDQVEIPEPDKEEGQFQELVLNGA